MGLETGSYITDLTSTNPLGSDDPITIDNHARLLKTVWKNVFPNITGAVNASHTELNYCNSLTATVQVQLDTKMELSATSLVRTNVKISPSAVRNDTLDQSSTSAFNYQYYVIPASNHSYNIFLDSNKGGSAVYAYINQGGVSAFESYTFLTIWNNTSSTRTVSYAVKRWT